VDTPSELAEKFRRRLLVPWLALLCFPVALGAEALYSQGWDAALGEIAGALNAPFIAGAIGVFAAAMFVLRRRVGHGIGQRVGMVDLSRFAKWWGIDIQSAKDLDALRSAIDDTMPHVVAWVLTEAAFAAAAVSWREPGSRMMTSATAAFILFLARP